jgi:hypothetical protein
MVPIKDKVNRNNENKKLNICLSAMVLLYLLIRQRLYHDVFKENDTFWVMPL